MNTDGESGALSPDPHLWFLVQCRPNCTSIAERNLGRQGFRTFLPLHQSTRRVGAKLAEVWRPLFPGYLFLGVMPGEQPWRAVNGTYGVSRLVAFADAPAQVPNGLMADLMRKRDAVDATTLVPGDDVRVTSGSFADFLATVDGVSPDRRVWILLDLMGRRLRINLPIDAVACVA